MQTKRATSLSNPFDEADLETASECLKALAHPTRLRLVGIVLKNRVTVGRLAEAVGETQPRVSGHMRILEARGMVKGVREGTQVFYKVHNPVLAQICTCIRNHFQACDLNGAPVKRRRAS